MKWEEIFNINIFAVKKYWPSYLFPPSTESKRCLKISEAREAQCGVHVFMYCMFLCCHDKLL